MFLRKNFVAAGVSTILLLVAFFSVIISNLNPSVVSAGGLNVLCSPTVLGANMTSDRMYSSDGTLYPDTVRKSWTLEEAYGKGMSFPAYFGEGGDSTYFVFDSDPGVDRVANKQDTRFYKGLQKIGIQGDLDAIYDRWDPKVQKVRTTELCYRSGYGHFYNAMLALVGFFTAVARWLLGAVFSGTFICNGAGMSASDTCVDLAKIIGGSSNAADDGIISLLTSGFYIPMALIVVTVSMLYVSYIGLIKGRIREAFTEIWSTFAAMALSLLFMFMPATVATFPVAATNTLLGCMVLGLNGGSCISGSESLEQTFLDSEKGSTNSCISVLGSSPGDNSVFARAMAESTTMMICNIWYTTNLAAYSHGSFGLNYTELDTLEPTSKAYKVLNGLDFQGNPIEGAPKLDGRNFCVPLGQAKIGDGSPNGLEGKPIYLDSNGGREICNVAAFQMYLQTNNNPDISPDSIDYRWYNVVSFALMNDAVWSSWTPGVIANNTKFNATAVSTIIALIILSCVIMLAVTCLKLLVFSFLKIAILPIGLLAALLPGRNRAKAKGYIISIGEDYIKYAQAIASLLLLLIIYTRVSEAGDKLGSASRFFDAMLVVLLAYGLARVWGAFRNENRFIDPAYNWAKSQYQQHLGSRLGGKKGQAGATGGSAAAAAEAAAGAAAGGASSGGGTSGAGGSSGKKGKRYQKQTGEASTDSGGNSNPNSNSNSNSNSGAGDNVDGGESFDGNSGEGSYDGGSQPNMGNTQGEGADGSVEGGVNDESDYNEQENNVEGGSESESVPDGQEYNSREYEGKTVNSNSDLENTVENDGNPPVNRVGDGEGSAENTGDLEGGTGPQNTTGDTQNSQNNVGDGKYERQGFGDSNSTDSAEQNKGNVGEKVKGALNDWKDHFKEPSLPDDMEDIATQEAQRKWMADGMAGATAGGTDGDAGGGESGDAKAGGNKAAGGGHNVSSKSNVSERQDFKENNNKNNASNTNSNKLLDDDYDIDDPFDNINRNNSNDNSNSGGNTTQTQTQNQSMVDKMSENVRQEREQREQSDLRKNEIRKTSESDNNTENSTPKTPQPQTQTQAQPQEQVDGGQQKNSPKQTSSKTNYKKEPSGNQTRPKPQTRPQPQSTNKPIDVNEKTPIVPPQNLPIDDVFENSRQTQPPIPKTPTDGNITRNSPTTNTNQPKLNGNRDRGSGNNRPPTNRRPLR